MNGLFLENLTALLYSNKTIRPHRHYRGMAADNDQDLQNLQLDLDLNYASVTWF